MKLGSLPRQMTLFEAVRGAGVDPLGICGGDFLFDLDNFQANAFEREQLHEKARVIIESYNRMRYRVAAVGECDLVLGLDTLLKLRTAMSFPLVCANLVRAETGETVFEPSVLVEHQGYRVAVIGVLLEGLSPTFLKRALPGCKVLPPVAAARAEAERLRPQADVVFVIAQTNRPEADAIADQIPEVDFVLDANSFGGNQVLWLQPNQYFVPRAGKVQLRCDGQGSMVGRLDLTVHAPGRPWQPVQNAPPADPAADATSNRYVGTSIVLGPQYGNEPGVQALLEAFKSASRFVQTEAPAEFQPSRDYLTESTCVACHPVQHEFWQRTSHAHAYQTLVKSNDQHRVDCLPCHVLGYGETFIDPRQGAAFGNVQCENCHGKNPQHPSAPVEHPWPRVDVKLCWGCHNPRETLAPFEPDTALPIVTCPPLARERR